MRLKHYLTFILALLLCVALVGCGLTAPAERVPEYEEEGFVLITDVVPDAILEIRYYSTFNFVGERIDDYEDLLHI